MGPNRQPTIRVTTISKAVLPRLLLRVYRDFTRKRMLVVVVNWNADNSDNGRHGQSVIKVWKQVTVSRWFPDDGQMSSIHSD